MSILHDMKLSSDLKVDPVYLTDIPELKPNTEEIAYYNAIMNRIPEPDRKRIKEIYAKRGEQIRQLKPKGQDLLRLKYMWYLQDYLACVASIDENVGRVLNYLEEKGLSKNTLLIYTSDQGMYLGENGWFDKRWMYEVSMQTPLLIRWPGHIKPTTQFYQMVQNIDFAPTFLEAAGISIPGSMQGISLLPVIKNDQKKLKRQHLYYHFYEYNVDHTVLQHLGVRGERYKLIYFYPVNEWELYDLKTDPYELKNLNRSPAHQKILSQMKKELLKLRNLYDDHEEAGELH